MYFHLKKTKTWYVIEGTFWFRQIDLDRGIEDSRILVHDDVVHLSAGTPHRLEAFADGGTILEVSTPHIDGDVYRLAPGESQLKVESPG
jgi:quercetin dioxygenase-like cupin family protein